MAPVLSFPPFRLDAADERLWKGDHELKLRRKPFAILKYLVTHPQRLVTQEELTQAIWGKVAMSENLLRTHVYELRHVLGDGWVETVIGRGYRFVAQVLEQSHSTSPADARATSEVLKPPLVGRSAEIAALRMRLEAAISGARQIAFVQGEPGIGKTALVEALLEHAAFDGALVARGTCVEQYGSGEAYLPVLGALGAACRGERGAHVIEILGRHAPMWLMQMPGLIADDKLAGLQLRVQGATQARMLRELADALEALSDTAPIVLALDDLQWCDDSTAALLAMLGRRQERARLLVIGTYRHSDLPKTHPLSKAVGELIAHRQATTFALDRLGQEAVGEYIDARWPSHASPDLARTVHEATGGNALFMVALLDDLETRQMVRKVEAGWEVRATVAEILARRPDSVRQLIDIQIDRLGVSEQRILEAAGAAGMEFAAGVVAAALEIAVDDVDSCCEELATQGRFLRYVGTEPWPDDSLQSRYAFVHALYRDAARSRSSPALTRLWHRRIGERLETAHGDAAEAIAAELAAHFDAAHSFAKAVLYYDLAGSRSGRRSGTAEALAHFERARDLLPRLPPGRPRDELELRVLRRLGRTTIAANALQNPQLVPTFMRAAELARSLDDDLSLGAALVGLQQCRMLQGALREIDAHAAEVEDVATRISDPVIANWGRLMAAVAALHRGRLVDARNALASGATGVREHVASTSGAEGPSFPYGPLLFSNLATAEWLVGHPDAALESALESISLAESLEDPFTLSLGLAAAATVQAWRHADGSALEFARRGMRAAADAGSGLGMTRASAIFQLASVRLEQTPPASALREVDKALSVQAPPSRAGRTNFALVLIEIAARAGETERALNEIADALEFAEAHDERTWEPELYRLRGELLKATDKLAAERSFVTAVKLARAQASRSFELRAVMSLHRLSSGATKRKAFEELRELYAAFKEGFATGDLSEAGRTLERVADRGQSEA